MVDLATDQTIVFNGPCLLVGIYVNTVTSAHTCNISDGAVTALILKASYAASTNLELNGIEFKTSLVINPNAAATGNITVFYIPLNQ